ncbi:MAG: coproporphyrinogen dehydrogenase HemZ [Clostridiales bacterium]|nr:coproporphyrinogen dehydrogenase HemZ [Clostridiales bacterium]
MIINFEDKTNSVNVNYLQSLVLMYLPCEKFALSDDDKSSLALNADYDENKSEYTVKTVLSHNGKICEKTLCEIKDESNANQGKNVVGKAFLECAKEIFGYVPQWGIMTGIRPAKVAVNYLLNHSESETRKYLEKEYLVSKNRAKVCVMTAVNEMKVVKNIKDNSASVYISIPFCPSKCRYCSFVSSSTKKLLSLIPDYLEKLYSDIEKISRFSKSSGIKIETVYIGGGTPAILDENQISKLLHVVNDNLFSSDLREFTFEAGRPDCTTKEKLKIIKNAGVTRLSINTQTTNDDILCAVGRKHTFDDYKSCMNEAHDAGFDNINTDLIAGLPGESEKSFEKSVDDIFEVSPSNITVHTFALKKSSVYKTQDAEKIDANSKTAAKMINYSSKTLISGGYEPYYMYKQKNTVGNLDNTGYSKKGFECLYNVYMMGEYHTVFSAGADGSTKYVSHDRNTIKRIFSPKYPYEYLDESKYAGFDEKSAYEFYEKYY